MSCRHAVPDVSNIGTTLRAGGRVHYIK